MIISEYLMVWDHSYDSIKSMLESFGGHEYDTLDTLLNDGMHCGDCNEFSIGAFAANLNEGLMIAELTMTFEDAEQEYQWRHFHDDITNGSYVRPMPKVNIFDIKAKTIQELMIELM